MANADHVAQLMKGVTAWNAWRDSNPTLHPDLSRADLGDADLSKANLTGANFTRGRPHSGFTRPDPISSSKD
jgi:uncharacterized protein YjbI with pentapeptide repeats